MVQREKARGEIKEKNKSYRSKSNNKSRLKHLQDSLGVLLNLLRKVLS